MSDTDSARAALIAECERQAENCLYTGASLYIWLKRARWWRALFLVVPAVLSGFATSQMLGQYLGATGNFIAAASGLLAGFFPVIFVALNMDMKVIELSRSAAEYTNLRDRFRQLATVKSQGDFKSFETGFETLMDRMDAVRSSAPPIPEWCFRKAQKKVQKGDYKYDRDIAPPVTPPRAQPSVRRP